MKKKIFFMMLTLAVCMSFKVIGNLESMPTAPKLGEPCKLNPEPWEKCASTTLVCGMIYGGGIEWGICIPDPNFEW
jgi:hypothetical protein